MPSPIIPPAVLTKGFSFRNKKDSSNQSFTSPTSIYWFRFDLNPQMRTIQIYLHWYMSFHFWGHKKSIRNACPILDEIILHTPSIFLYHWVWYTPPKPLLSPEIQYMFPLYFLNIYFFSFLVREGGFEPPIYGFPI